MVSTRTQGGSLGGGRTGKQARLAFEVLRQPLRCVRHPPLLRCGMRCADGTAAVTESGLRAGCSISDPAGAGPRRLPSGRNPEAQRVLLLLASSQVLRCRPLFDELGGPPPAEASPPNAELGEELQLPLSSRSLKNARLWPRTGRGLRTASASLILKRPGGALRPRRGPRSVRRAGAPSPPSHGHALARGAGRQDPDLPEALRRLLTWDQGTEMARHLDSPCPPGWRFYFCDPHSLAAGFEREHQRPPPHLVWVC